jgi:hypothetical protein
MFFKKEVNAKYLLEVVGEEAIFERYLGFYPNLDITYSNPLRKDGEPGCKFYHNGVKLKFHDISRGFNEDCFGVVMKKFNCSFGKAISIIASDFGIVQGLELPPVEKKVYKIDETVETIIIPTTRLLTKRDIDFWKPLVGSSEYLDKHQIYSIESFYLSSRKGERFFQIEQNELCYGYKEIYKGQDKWQIYQPEKPKGIGKWYNNIPSQLYHGYNQLPEKGEIVIQTKSKKDIVTLDSLGIPAYGPLSEVGTLSFNGYSIMTSRFNQIYTLFDYDIAGIKAARRHYQMYNIPYLFITTGEKDVAQYVRTHGRKKTKEMIQRLKEQLYEKR